MKSIAANYQNRFMIENTCLEKHFLVDLQSKYIPHKNISAKLKDISEKIQYAF